MRPFLHGFEWIGEQVIYYLSQAGRMGIFLAVCLLRLFRPPYKIFPISQPDAFIGAQSFFRHLFTGAFTGMVLGPAGILYPAQIRIRRAARLGGSPEPDPRTWTGGGRP